jgi:uncharacterized phiE125 gp8 family phage protein
MPLYLVEAPTTPALSLDDAKDYLRVDINDDDDLITACIAAAEQNLDGRDGWLGRALVSQIWDYKLAEFGGCEIRIPLPPLIAVESVQYYDADNVLQTLASDVYEVVGVGGFGKAAIVLKHGQRWPATYPRAEAVAIRFRAGYVDTSDSPASGEVPAPIITAMKRTVGSLYEHRETVVVGTSANELPGAVKSLLAPYRVY